VFFGDGKVDGVHQSEATFSIGIDHFDGLAGHRADQVSGVISVARDHVFTGGHDAHQIDLELESGGSAHGTYHRCGSSHVVFHVDHALGGLDAVSTAVIGETFPDQADRLVFGVGIAVVAHDDETRLGFGAFAHRQKGVHLDAADLVRGVDLDIEAILEGGFFGCFSQGFRIDHVGRFVDELTRHIGGLGKDASFQDAAVDMAGVFEVDCQVQRFDGMLFVRAQILGKFVLCQQGSFSQDVTKLHIPDRNLETGKQVYQLGI